MEILQNALVCAIKESLSIDLVQSAESNSDSKNSDSANLAFASKITLGTKTFIIAPNEVLLAQFATSFLDSASPSQSTLKDIAKEIANLIVGKAKVLFEEQGQILKLGLPMILESAQIPSPSRAYAYESGEIKICIYEIQGCENGGK